VDVVIAASMVGVWNSVGMSLGEIRSLPVTRGLKSAMTEWSWRLLMRAVGGTVEGMGKERGVNALVEGDIFVTGVEFSDENDQKSQDNKRLFDSFENYNSYSLEAARDL
jgi:hypothetical protein